MPEPQKNKGGEETEVLLEVEKDLGKMDSSGKPEMTLGQKYTKIFMVVSLYWFISITMVFVNKSLLSGQGNLSAPFFVTWFQCVVTVAGCYALLALSRAAPRMFSFPDIEFKPAVAKQVLPLSVVFVAMITFNNLCLQHVGVSFYNVGRSLTTVFNVVMTFLIMGQKTSLKAIGCCGIIVFGFWLGVDQEGSGGTLSISGVIFGVLASLCVSLNAIFTKKVLPVVDNNIWLLSYYNNINATLLFIPIMVLGGEVNEVMNAEAIHTTSFWVEMFIGGIFGFAIGYVTGLQIQHTSPLTHNISGTAKAAAQTVIATQINNEIKTVMWWGSNVMVLSGSMAYARVKQLEMAANNANSRSPTKT